MTPEEKEAGLAVFRAAQRLESGLQFLYSRMLQIEGETFDAFVQDVRGDSLGVNGDVFEELEQIVIETDPDVTAARGEDYYCAMVKVAYALSLMAVHFAMAKQYTRAWERLTAGHAWMGFLNGRMRRFWEEARERSEAGARLNDVVHAENRSSREEAMEWYDLHRDEFKNDDDRAMAIAEKIVPQKFATVRKWITQHRAKKK